MTEGGVIMAEYKLYGTKNRGQRVDSVILEGTSVDPVRVLRLRGDPVEMSDEEVEQYRARGLELRKVSGSDEPPKEAEPEEAPDEAFVTPKAETSKKTPKS
jgi:hypothetical protein